MDYIAPLFKNVSTGFSILSSLGGVHAIYDPKGFSDSFGLSLRRALVTEKTPEAERQEQYALFYATLMGVRQLGTALTIIVFSWQNKWREVATILAIIGVLVAGMDAVCLSKAGMSSAARWHAIPGLAIAALAAVALYMDDL